MGFRLIALQLLGRKMSISLKDNLKEVEIQVLQISTSPAVLLDKKNCSESRPASKDELLSFARKYHPAKWHPPIFGMDQKTEPTILGPMTMLYKTNGTKVEMAFQNPVRGLPAGSLVLFVKV